MRRYFFILGFCLTFAVAGCGDNGPSKGLYGKTKEVPPGYFAKVRLEYVLTDSGEPFVIEYISACGAQVIDTRHAGRSVFPTIIPRFYSVPTPDKKSAISVKLSGICDDRPIDAYAGRTDFWPKIIWHDDIKRLSFGWGYLSIRAYESPLAKVKLVSGTIDKTTHAEWIAWRAKVKKDYVQIGGLPGPYGFAGSGDRRADREFFRSVNGNYNFPTGCSYHKRIQVPKAMMAQVLAIWPEGVGKYWALSGTKDENHRMKNREAHAILHSARYAGGWRLAQMKSNIWQQDLFYGYPPKNKQYNYDPEQDLALKEIELVNGRFLPEIYPTQPRSLSMPGGMDITTPQDRYFNNIPASKEWDGFASCGSLAPIDRLTRVPRTFIDGTRVVDQEVTSKSHELYVNGEKALENLHNQYGPATIVDKAGFVFYSN